LPGSEGRREERGGEGAGGRNDNVCTCELMNNEKFFKKRYLDHFSVFF
jgi:hypothetical protein